MPLRQILGSQRRPKIMVMLPNQRNRMIANSVAEPAVATASTTSGNQARRTVRAHPYQQSINLPTRQTEQRCCILGPQLPAFNT
ncbi:hypothetical protein SFOMI_5317 [Sphingobium fuliginis]|uniref:Uncharacterized protein n=1 Tax=Sphingobium fuliginis (strain ATCC 27551) TaxID=336203 RepID=A0A292ZJ14_SPHSA|nr:hypothetical protein SFOMI_5317 [Sphingobium fuliginis]